VTDIKQRGKKTEQNQRQIRRSKGQT